MERDETISQIKTALKRRSGKPWSVTGGRGTAWGWITIDAPPARRKGKHRLKEGMPDLPENWEEYLDTEAGGHITPTERMELLNLLSLDAVHNQGIMIPASYHYWQEYVDRANGRTPSVIGEPYWD